MSTRLALTWTLLLLWLSGAAFAQSTDHSQDSPARSDWHAMGQWPCAWSEAIQKADGSLDIAKMVTLLSRDGFRCHAMAIAGGPPYSWNEFQQLVAAADAAGIDEWPVLIPPTEGSSSPYQHDFVAWIKALAKLSLRYPHLRGANIDDLDQGENAKLFSRDYICRIYQAKQTTNPKFLFVPTIYSLNRDFADRMSGCVDGVWLWWSKLETVEGLATSLERAAAASAGRFPIYGGVYAHWTSWHKQGPPKKEIFEQTLQKTCELASGAIIWKITIQPPDPLLEVARSYTGKAKSTLMGHCGENSAEPQAALR